MPLENLSILFDLDGTLVDTAPDLLNTLNHVLAEINCPAVAPEKIRSFIGNGAKAMINAALTDLNKTISEAKLDELFDLFLAHYAENIAVHSRPFDGVEKALQHLKQAEVKLGVCTNKKEYHSIKLIEALKLDHYFSAIVGGDTLEIKKPHPGHLFATLERIGGQAGKAVMIGDSATDINAAKAANIPVIAVSFGYTSTPVSELSPDLVIDHFDELVPGLEKMMLSK